MPGPAPIGARSVGRGGPVRPGSSGAGRGPTSKRDAARAGGPGKVSGQCWRGVALGIARGPRRPVHRGSRLRTRLGSGSGAFREPGTSREHDFPGAPYRSDALAGTRERTPFTFVKSTPRALRGAGGYALISTAENFPRGSAKEVGDVSRKHGGPWSPRCERTARSTTTPSPGWSSSTSTPAPMPSSRSGTTGESATLDHDEHREVVRKVHRGGGGKGAGHRGGPGRTRQPRPCTSPATRRPSGADACLLVTPLLQQAHPGGALPALQAHRGVRRRPPRSSTTCRGARPATCSPTRWAGSRGSRTSCPSRKRPETSPGSARSSTGRPTDSRS